MTQFQQKGFELVKGFIPPFFSTYLRNYFTLRVQTDRSLGGEYDQQWPIWIKDYDGIDHCVELDEGDMLV